MCAYAIKAEVAGDDQDRDALVLTMVDHSSVRGDARCAVRRVYLEHVSLVDDLVDLEERVKASGSQPGDADWNESARDSYRRFGSSRVAGPVIIPIRVAKPAVPLITRILRCAEVKAGGHRKPLTT